MFKTTRALRILSLLLLFSGTTIAGPVDTAVVYQGRLQESGSPANGTYDMYFQVFNAAIGGSFVSNAGSSANPLVVSVVDGLFTVDLAFAPEQTYNGTERWLQVHVRKQGNVNYTTLLPRQRLAAAPFANLALDALAADTATVADMANDIPAQWKAFSFIAGVGPVYNGSGKVGIGTATPEARLHVVGSSNLAAQVTSSSTIGTWLNLENTSTDGRFWGLISTGSDNGGGAGNLLVSHGTSAGIADGLLMTFTPDNKVGVGTATPEARLHVRGVGGTTANGVRMTHASEGSNWDLLIGGSGNSFPGGFAIADEGVAKMVVTSAGNVGVGTTAPVTKLHVNGTTRTNILEVVGGSDVAEPYTIEPAGDVVAIPGMVVSIHPDQIGQLRVASRAYDPTVAGIVSGANGIQPGLTLKQEGTIADGSLPVASIGRVWCLVDAGAGGSVQPGDLLTSSPVAGHAMKVNDRSLANGAIIGKAMSSLEKGRGYVLVLVSLQ